MLIGQLKEWRREKVQCDNKMVTNSIEKICCFSCGRSSFVEKLWSKRLYLKVPPIPEAMFTSNFILLPVSSWGKLNFIVPHVEWTTLMTKVGREIKNLKPEKKNLFHSFRQPYLMKKLFLQQLCTFYSRSLIAQARYSRKIHNKMGFEPYVRGKLVWEFVKLNVVQDVPI